MEIYIGNKKIVSGTKIIIYDILLWSSNICALFVYLECICKVHRKYRVSFRLDKCDFLKPRVEYVRHDVTNDGNCPASTKFSMINDRKIPERGENLFSFIGLINFYHRYAPYMEIRLKPLRKLLKQYYRKTIHIMACIPDLISIFEELKVTIISSPMLARFDPLKPTFLKIDWSGEEMGWTLMQPTDDIESTKATNVLLKCGECTYDFSKDGVRLNPVRFGSRAYTDFERKYHSFVGEAPSGRCAISQNRHYLWGTNFW